MCSFVPLLSDWLVLHSAPVCCALVCKAVLSLSLSQLIAVYEEEEVQQRAAASPGAGSATGRPSPDPYDSELSVFQPIAGGEIEVNSSALKSSKFPLASRAGASNPGVGVWKRVAEALLSAQT